MASRRDADLKLKLSAGESMKRIDVQWVGKAGTFGLMCTFPLFLAGSGDIAGSTLFTALGWLIGVPSLLISWYAAITYAPLMRDALYEGRKERR